ncbi:MAG: flagellar motor protein MotB [Gallionellaceae bacterium]|nr:flagellar motor protein MotB [Gallionellaceae bacterium]
MADDTQRPIVIKRIKKISGGGHAGGAWKIAYADFVTAMMAFFLLMWLLGSTTKAQMEGIAQYFKTPLKVALAGGEGSGDSSSIIKGGGQDLTRRAGQVKQGEVEGKKAINLEASRSEQVKQESARLENLKATLEKAIASNPKMSQFKKQLKIDIISEGLRIQIIDDKNRPMFDSGRAVMKPYTRDILREIGKTLNEVPNRISLSGHTDAIAYFGGERGYSNWELSADRANASRRELAAGGLEDGKVLRVVGLGSAIPFDKENPNDPVNRRISIIVMNKKAEEAITKESRQIEAETAKEVAEQLNVKH